MNIGYIAGFTLNWSSCCLCFARLALEARERTIEAQIRPGVVSIPIYLPRLATAFYNLDGIEFRATFYFGSTAGMNSIETLL